MQIEPSLEILRWGLVQIPIMLYSYAAELDLDAEDLGIIGGILFVYNRSKPMTGTGVEVGQVLQVCPVISKNRLSRKLGKWEKAGLIRLEGSPKSDFASRKIYLEPLYYRMREIIIRDHPAIAKDAYQNEEALIRAQEKRIEELEKELQQERRRNNSLHESTPGNKDYKLVADFISQKTGNLLSIKMSNELRKWMDELGFKTEFILCMLELCFERNIYHPREISRIANGLKECSINSLEAMEAYFRTFVDDKPPQTYGFDPEIIEFGHYTGLDMSAEARKKVYYKWRYDWGFSPEMIKRAGEIMCNRTKNGGLDYIDGILNNWREKNIRSLKDVEAEMLEHQSRRKTADKPVRIARMPVEEREIYIPPNNSREGTAVGK